MAVTVATAVAVKEISSSCGPPLAIILSQWFAEPTFRARILEGLNPYLLAPPVLLASEPFAHSLNATTPQSERIGANAFAFRAELAELQRRRAVQYAFLVGLANAGGAVLDTQTEIARNMGAGLYTLCKAWPYLKARWVDCVDVEKYTSRYLGHDVPEALFPDEPHPRYGSPPAPRRDSRTHNDEEDHHV